MLDQLALAADILHTNALLIDHAIAYAKWLGPGLTAAGGWWAGYRATRWVQARYTARRQARTALRQAHAGLAHDVGPDALRLLEDLDAHYADVIAADAELDRRIRQLADDARRDGQQ